jgi:hypothetical protein
MREEQARNGDSAMIGDQVKIITGLAIGNIGTLVGIIQPTLSHVPTYIVKFSDFEHPQAYFSWEVGRIDTSPPENVKANIT